MSASPIPMRPRVSLAAMKKARKRLAVDTDYGVINVVYRPGAVSPHLLRLIDEEKTHAAIISQIRALIDSWDVMADDAAIEPIALDDPLVEDFDLNVLAAIAKAVAEDMQPGEATSVGSFSG